MLSEPRRFVENAPRSADRSRARRRNGERDAVECEEKSQQR